MILASNIAVNLIASAGEKLASLRAAKLLVDSFINNQD
ncbi:MAG: hypothetical protein OFPI_34680 [Osedax symbiont Rs2]|nr:MAG: hypothetical protein OFPI_34680 [Osedax symbiont Rs2]